MNDELWHLVLKLFSTSFHCVLYKIYARAFNQSLNKKVFLIKPFVNFVYYCTFLYICAPFSMVYLLKYCISWSSTYWILSLKIVCLNVPPPVITSFTAGWDVTLFPLPIPWLFSAMGPEKVVKCGICKITISNICEHTLIIAYNTTQLGIV